MTSSYKLSIETMSAAVWPQFRMQSCCLQPITNVRRISVSHPSADFSVWYASPKRVWHCSHSGK